jgi:hypothetical protein
MQQGMQQELTLKQSFQVLTQPSMEFLECFLEVLIEQMD